METFAWIVVCQAQEIALIAILFMDEVKAGNYKLEDEYKIKGSDIVEGSPALQNKQAGTKISFGTLLEKMITVNDNTATNMLIDILGMHRNEEGKLQEPMEALTIDVPQDFMGAVMEGLGLRKAELLNMTEMAGYLRMVPMNLSNYR